MPSIVEIEVKQTHFVNNSLSVKCCNLSKFSLNHLCIISNAE